MMNRDDSDLSSLSDEDVQGDNGSEMDDDDQDVTFDFSAPTHTDKFSPVSFDFQEVGLPPHCVKNYNDYTGRLRSSGLYH
ncbi:hypothetical protein TNIN_256681 [Trichonephila inaurata madagascariensis]|uniref:Uncharacterized protein n=1 Tax=Trichonephila inaurata madagascariensis TaxID=2747483 RepID=A0A8X6YE44_9ARAC|nr:hypothetical protein TNIN_256681 [Trichonephila inaurata madagascariensis]